MDRARAEQLEKDVEMGQGPDSEYHFAFEFEDLPDVVKGMMILSAVDKRRDGNFSADVCAEHDIIYYTGYEESLPDITENEFLKLIELGWFEDADSWAHWT